VVFDLRGQPNSNHQILAHLLTQSVDLTKGMSIPHVIRPDHGPASMPAWETFPAMMSPLQPHIGGRVAFLTGAGAASYAESVLGLVDHYHLGKIVGMPTAGTDGNVAEITMPTGCRTSFTPMRVTRTNGEPRHLIGIQPAIPAARTIAGVAAGRDEPLEKALAYVRGSLQ
jgi:C-terminal processing protease CtpA/Prc